MFSNKKKIELDNQELRVIYNALINFRNDLVKENKYTDAIDEVLPKLKNKMKANKYDIGAILNGLDRTRNNMLEQNEDISSIDKLILKMLEIYKTL